MYNIIYTGKQEGNNNKKIIGLERDGVVNVFNGDPIKSPKDFIEIPGSLQAITKLKSKGFYVFFITDQGAINKGLLTQENVETVNKHMLNLLGQNGCSYIDGIYYSSSSKRNDMYAKPNVGMFKRCERENKNVKFKNGYYIGTTLNDIKAAYKIGATPVLLRTGVGKETEKTLEQSFYKKLKQKTLIFNTLRDFANSF